MGQIAQGEYYKFEGGKYDGQTLRVTVQGDYVQLEDIQPDLQPLGYADGPVINDYTYKVLTYFKTQRFAANNRDWWWVFVLV